MEASLHNYIKIKTKIENSHHSEHSEIQGELSLTTMELKKITPIQTGSRGAGVQLGWALTCGG